MNLTDSELIEIINGNNAEWKELEESRHFDGQTMLNTDYSAVFEYKSKFYRIRWLGPLGIDFHNKNIQIDHHHTTIEEVKKVKVEYEAWEKV